MHRKYIKDRKYGTNVYVIDKKTRETRKRENDNAITQKRRLGFGKKEYRK